MIEKSSNKLLKHLLKDKVFFASRDAYILHFRQTKNISKVKFINEFFLDGIFSARYMSKI